MGLLREDVTPKRALARFSDYTPTLGVCQWFHFEDPRLDDAVRWLQRLNVRYLRTGISWADSLRPGGDRWIARLLSALDPFIVTATFCFTPECHGIRPHHTSPPREPDRFAAFCGRVIAEYAA